MILLYLHLEVVDFICQERSYLGTNDDRNCRATATPHFTFVSKKLANQSSRMANEGAGAWIEFRIAGTAAMGGADGRP